MRLSVENKTEENGVLVIERTKGDKRYYTESSLLYAIKNHLKALGFDVIKKRIAKDYDRFGHMFGHDAMQYIRTSNRVKGIESFWVVDKAWESRLIHEDFNQKGRVCLALDRNIQ